MVQRKRLEQKIRSAGFHGPDGGFHAAEGRHHHHRHLAVLAADQPQKLQAIHVGQFEIGEHHIGAIDNLQGLFGGTGVIHLKARGGQLQPDDAPQLLFVFDNQDAFFHAGFAPAVWRALGSTGRSTRKTLPLPGSLSTVILPPCSSTILETMANPNPTPCGLVVKNGLKMESRCFASIPAPRSITAISTIPPIARVFTVTAPPASVACTAFSTRL